MQLDVIADYANETGEGPLWHVAEQALYWVDIPTARLFRYHPESDKHELVLHDRPVGGFTYQQDGALLLFRDKGNVVLWRYGQGIVATVIEKIDEHADTRFNDVCAAPAGGVFCGTMSSKTIKGRLHYLDPDGKLTVLLTDQGTPNGMGYSPDRRTMYYNDSSAAATWAFDHDEKTAKLTNQRKLRDAKASDDRGRPDGLCVDSEGCIWTARWDGGCIIRHATDGSILQTIDIPARNITSVAFGGPDLDDLYVSSAGGHLKSDAAHGPNAGALFRIRGLGIKGQREYLSRVRA